MIRKEIADAIHLKLPKDRNYFRCKKCSRITFSHFDSIDCHFCGKHMELISRETALNEMKSRKFGGI